MDKIESLKKAVFSKRPVLEQIFREHGNENLLEYKKNYKNNETAVNQQEKNELINEIRIYAESLYGPDISESVAKQLDKYYYVSTTDHHGPISHPFFVHADILGSLKTHDEPMHNNFIVLACGNVSLNNSSQPKKILFHANGRMENINFFPSRYNKYPVLSMRALDKNDLASINAGIENKYWARPKIKNGLLAFMNKFYASDRILKLKDYSQQMSAANFEIWKNIFPDKQLNNLIYLQLETLTINLLRKHHIHKKTNVHEFIFNPEILDQIEILADKIPGAFSKQENKGTFLFWYLPENGRTRTPLMRKGNELISKDGSYRMRLTPEDVEKAAANNTLIPSNMLSMAILSCYYEIKCLGGFSQSSYLASIQKIWDQIFMHSRHRITRTDSLCGDFAIGALCTQNEMAAATALDFILYADGQSYDNFIKTAGKITLEESMLPMMPELYKILYTENERIAELAEIKASDIIRSIADQNKIYPCLNEKNL